MKLLLDENLPHALRRLLPGHDVFTARYMGWDGLSNGHLLRTAADKGFEALLTMDNGVAYQQNVRTLPLSVVILYAEGNDLDSLRPLIPELLRRLAASAPRTVVHVSVP